MLAHKDDIIMLVQNVVDDFKLSVTKLIFLLPTYLNRHQHQFTIFSSQSIIF